MSSKAHVFQDEIYNRLIVYTGAFSAAYLIFYILWGALGYKSVRRASLSSCSISFYHGVIAIIVATTEVTRAWPLDMGRPNSAPTTELLLISTGYFITDALLFLLPFTPDDYLFIGHHIATSTYMLWAINSNKGGISALCLMLMGEVTSPLQNVWNILKDARVRSQAAERGYKAISPVYTYVYIFFRSVVGPPVILYVIYGLLTTPHLGPAARYTWSATALLTLFGSQIWSFKLYQGLQKVKRKSATNIKAE